MMSKRNYQLDNIRAIAILLVVFGHSIILYSSSWNYYATAVEAPLFDYIKSWINLIQMPIFFSLSGYLFYFGYSKKSMIELMKNKAYRLLIPYILVAALYMIPIKLFVNYPNYEGRSYFNILFNDILLFKDNGHLWFLPTLFICFVVGKVVYELRKKLGKQNQYIFDLLVGGGLMLLATLLSISTLLYFVWFYIGGMLNAYADKFALLKELKWKIVIGLSSLILSILSLSYPNKLQVITSLILLIMFYVFVPNKKSDTCNFLSKYSFGIYLFHSPLIYITFSMFADKNPLIVAGLNFIVFGSIATLIAVANEKLQDKYFYKS